MFWIIDYGMTGLREIRIPTAAAALSLVAQGCARRHVAETAMNQASSRSHTLLTLSCTTGSRHARLHLVDLAGSESQKQTQTCTRVIGAGSMS
jgi:hypothetical protein